MNILILGDGGREHAIGWKSKENPKVKKLFFALGNAGTASIGENIELDFSNFEKIVSWIKDNKVDLVIIGPARYLEDGLTDILIEAEINVFGPTKSASKIELSKIYAKELMNDENIPTAQFETFSDYNKAYDYIDKCQSWPIVIKADGQWFGEATFITKDKKEARYAVEKLMIDLKYGEAGSKILIEEFLEGREISVHAFCDGNDAIIFPAAQDHKRLYDGDKGPNTAGVGAIAPVSWVSEKELLEIKEKIIIPILNALKKRGSPFVGVIYPGIMFTSSGPKVIEINARMGDPETQIFMKILDSDLLEIILACVDQNLQNIDVKWKDKYACCVTLVSGGYPESYKTGFPILGLDNITDKDIDVFHSGTKLIDGKLTTNGGRVLGVTSIGDSLEEAVNKAYDAVDQINFEDMYFRKDIGLKLLN